MGTKLPKPDGEGKNRLDKFGNRHTYEDHRQPLYGGGPRGKSAPAVAAAKSRFAAGQKAKASFNKAAYKADTRSEKNAGLRQRRDVAQAKRPKPPQPKGKSGNSIFDQIGRGIQERVDIVTGKSPSYVRGATRNRTPVFPYVNRVLDNKKTRP